MWMANTTPCWIPARITAHPFAKAQSAALICRLMIIVMNLVWTAKSSVAHGTAGNSKSKPANVSATPKYAPKTYPVTVEEGQLTVTV